MAKLFPNLPFISDETPLSWAGRLAAFHTFGPLTLFLNDLAIPLADLAGGVNGAVERLCDVAGHDPEPVLRNTIRRQGNRRLQLRDEVFSAEFLTGSITQFCPACLAANQANHARPHVAHRCRLAWMFRSVRTCPLHDIPLQQRKRGTWNDFAHELAVLVPETAAELQAIADKQPKRAPSPLQEYVLARLEGQGGPEWLDQQSLEQAVKATEMLGAVIAFGSDARAADLDADAWDQAGRAGWSYVVGGERGVYAALSAIGETRRMKKTDALLRSGDFGMLYSWLSASKLTKDPGPIRDILRDHIVNTTDVVAGSRLMGEPIIEPRWSSIASLARSEHVHPLTLRNVLIARKVVPENAKSRPCSATLIDYKVGRDIAAAMNRAVPFTALPEMIQASRPMVKVLIDSGLLPPLREIGFKHGKVSCAVDRNHVEALFRKLESLAPMVNVTPPGMYDLAKSAEISRVTKAAIVPAVFRGHLSRVYRLKSKMGLNAVVVDPAEIREKEFELQPGVSLQMASGILGVDIEVMGNLISDLTHPPLLTATELFGRSEPCVDPSSLQKFLERWATISMLHAETGFRPEQIQSKLKAAKVKPAFDRKAIGIEIYPRSELHDLFIA